MEKFITILAWVFLVLSLIRILAVLFLPKNEIEQFLIKQAEMYGRDLIVEIIRVPIIVFIICFTWIISIYI